MRQIVLDTETTGLEIEQGHRIIEIGCVEIIDRKFTRQHFHQYINPEREIDDGALAIHGISREFLLNKPVFADIWQAFLAFVAGAELVIHNANFDINFINHEMQLMSSSVGSIQGHCRIVDSLEIARSKHPGQRNNLDALCKRYNVDNSQREQHGALLDAKILADVYLRMTGGQVALSLGVEQATAAGTTKITDRLDTHRQPLKVIKASEGEIRCHESRLDDIDKVSGESVWRRIFSHS